MSEIRGWLDEAQTIGWTCEDPEIAEFYSDLLDGSYWHGGEPAPWSSVRRDHERLQALCDAVAADYMRSQPFVAPKASLTNRRPPESYAYPEILLSPQQWEQAMREHVLTERMALRLNIPRYDGKVL